MPCRRWLTTHADPTSSVVYVGIDHFERQRRPGIEAGWAPWATEFPMCEPPYLSKEDMAEHARSLGLTPPRLYDWGFPHNNCGGACVRAGQKQWLRLLEVAPERFAAAEEQERLPRLRRGDYAVLRSRRGGQARTLLLSELRAEHTTHPTPASQRYPVRERARGTQNKNRT